MDIKYSVDNVVLDLKVENRFIGRLSDALSMGVVGDDVRQWQSSKIGAFRSNYAVSLDNGSSFYWGVHQNSDKPNDYYTTVRLDFNPSKVDNHPVFEYVRCGLIQHSKWVEIKRFDLAVDIPEDRRNCWLIKDQRTYKLYQNSSSDKTEYLGKRSTHGQIKLYNKQIESKLSYPLTRLEITLDYSANQFGHMGELERLWPTVRYIESGQLSFDDMIMSDTDRVLVLSCLEHPEYLKMLGRRVGKKIECILERYTHELKPDMDKYSDILKQLLQYGKSRIGYEEDYRSYIHLKTMPMPF